MRHDKNHEADKVRHYWLFDDEEVELFKKMLRRHKAVRCVSEIRTNKIIAVEGSSESLGKFEDDVF